MVIYYVKIIKNSDNGVEIIFLRVADKNSDIPNDV